jgi:poly-gamma-glutamate capsule biosynthesis protein CapA/YwtB (metallophosphatase superfamily)
MPTLIFGGDVAPIRDNCHDLLGELSPLLKGADLAVANLEIALTDKGTPARGKPITHTGPPDAIAALMAGGFDCFNMANNHVLDYGETALLDCLERLESAKAPIFGAGRNLKQAAAPLIIYRGGLKIGLLGYTSTLPQGFAATDMACGVNPLRVKTAWLTFRNPDEYPGTLPVVDTWPVPEDLERMTADIRALMARTDLVLVYQHWGCSMTEQVLAFQRSIGHAAIEAGAGGVFGGHQHVVSAIEFHNGAPIVHGMGNLVFDIFAPFLTEITHRTFLFKAEMTKSGLKDCEIIPCRAGVTGVYDKPVALPPGEGTGKDIVDTIARLSKPFGTRIEVKGGRVYVG